MNTWNSLHNHDFYKNRKILIKNDFGMENILGRHEEGTRI